MRCAAFLSTVGLSGTVYLHFYVSVDISFSLH